MDAFNYLSVLLSIIIGLAITQVLQGYRALLLARRHVRLYAPTVIWSGTLLLIAVQTWWSCFGLRTHAEWTFLAFFSVLVQTVVLYMLAAVVLPDIAPGDETDLRAHFYRERVTFSLLLVALLLASLAKTWILDRSLGGAANFAFHCAFGALAVVAALVKRPLFHEVMAPLIALAIVGYIALLFARL